jgi:rRNA-processing protein EBP2
MVTKSKLKMALAADKRVDYKKLNQKKRQKTAIKEKSKKSEGKGKKVEDEWEDLDEGSEDEIEGGVELDGEENESGSEEETAEPMQVCVSSSSN